MVQRRIPIARSAGTQVPQPTHRTSFLSPLGVEAVDAEPGPRGESTIVFAVPRIFFRNVM